MRFLFFPLILLLFLPLVGCDTVQAVLGSGPALALLDEAVDRGGKVSDATLGKGRDGLDKYCEGVPEPARLWLRKQLVTDKGNRLEAHCANGSASRPRAKEVADSFGYIRVRAVR